MPLYIFSFSPLIIMSLLRTVSKGYATVTEPAATTWAIPNLSRMLGFSYKLFCCVIGSKVDGPVDDDSLHRAKESWVETFYDAVSLEAFANAIHQTLVLSLCRTLANISSQPCPGKVKWVDNGKTGRPSSSPHSQGLHQRTS